MQSKRIQKILFVAILLIGAYFRFYNLIENTIWFGDTSRDVLVAKHMAEYKENFFVSPDANGGMGSVHNTPLYFWLLTFIWLIFQSIDSTVYFFFGVGILTIIMGYKLARLFEKNILSLIFPFFISISNFFISISRNVWQPHLLPLAQVVSLYFYVRGIKKQEFFLWSIQFAFIALHLHLSYFPLLITTIFLVIIKLIKTRKYKALLWNLVLIGGNFLAYLLLSRGVKLEKFSNLLLISSHKLFFTNVENNFQTLSEHIFSASSYRYYLLLFSLFLMFGTLLKIIYTKKSPKLDKELAEMIILMFSSIFTLGLYAGQVYFHYLYAYFLLFILAVSFILTRLTCCKYFIVPISMLVLSAFLSPGNKQFLQKTAQSELISSKQAAQAILRENIPLNTLSIKFCMDDGFDCTNGDSFNSSIWYFLEEQSSSKLGYISNIGNGNNYLPFNFKNKVQDLIVVCQYETQKCLDDLQVDESKSKLIYEDCNISAVYVGSQINLK